MADPTKTPLFLSLRWKTLFTAGFLAVAILGLMMWHVSDRYQRELAETLSNLRLRNIEFLERGIHRSGEDWQHDLNHSLRVDESLFAQSGDGQVNTILPDLARQLERDWSDLTDRAGASQLYLLDAESRLYRQWSTTKSSTGLIEQLTAITDDSIASASNLVCFEQCYQIIQRAIYHNNRQQARVLLVRPFDYLAQRFKGSQPRQVAILHLQASNQNEQSNNRWIDAWKATLLTANTDSELFNALEQAARQFSPQALLNQYRHIELDGKHLAVGLSPLRGTDNRNAHFVLVTNITKEHLHIVKGLIQNSVVMASLLSVLALCFAYITWSYLRRIKQQLQVLPMLGQKQYREVRNIISGNRTASLYLDEFDELDNSVTALSYQLESLENAVNHRTREMERLSLFDPLTGLANRNLFLYELQRDVQRFQQHGGMLAIVILDLDKFKRINDTLGHQLGDVLLSKIGSRLRTSARTLGLVSRLGEDRFALILRSAKKFAQIEVLCQKILDLIHKPISLDHHNISTSCSLGISLAGAEQNADDLVKNAELALHKAKESGGNSFRVFSPSMATEAHINLSLESEIRRAFKNREFTLFLQPKVNMDSQIVGFESLVRWDHPDRGLLPPNEFIPAMESMGLIGQLDNFILDSSCRQIKILNQHFSDINVAVNISSTHFTEKSFLSYLQNCLQRHHVDPQCLELEITETLLMENMDVGMEIIHKIKELGVSIAIDDFGTGYSSLSYLKKLPVDTIKIDREFIKDIPDSESDMQISSVIIFLAKQLNFKVVAEGVETSEQMVFLKANQCDLAQGFYFSKPIAAHKAMILLESQRRDKKLNIKQSL